MRGDDGKVGLLEEGLCDLENEEYDSAGTDDTVKVASDSEESKSASLAVPIPVELGDTTKKKRNRSIKSPYRCNKCKQIKKGHVCTGSISRPTPKDVEPLCTTYPVLINSKIETNDALMATVSTANLITSSASSLPNNIMPINFSLGWFDMAINALSDLQKDLEATVQPGEEQNYLTELIQHLPAEKQYLASMKDEFEKESENIASITILGKRKYFEEEMVETEPGDPQQKRFCT